jgi:hypothetical protein
VVSLIATVMGFIIHRMRTRSAASAGPASANTNQNTIAPVFNIGVGQTPAPNPPNPLPAAPPPQVERRLPNMVCINAYVGTAWRVSPGTWSAINSGRRLDLPAFVVEFQNEARVRGNVGGPVNAHVAYSTRTQGEVRAVRGCWLEEGLSYADFRVDAIHRLLVGLRLDPGELVAVNKMNTISLGEVPTESISVAGTEPWQVYIRLTDANSGDLLYQGNFHMTIEPPHIFRL